MVDLGMNKKSNELIDGTYKAIIGLYIVASMATLAGFLGKIKVLSITGFFLFVLFGICFISYWLYHDYRMYNDLMD